MKTVIGISVLALTIGLCGTATADPAPAKPTPSCVRDSAGNTVCDSPGATINGKPVKGRTLSAQEAAQAVRDADERARNAVKAAEKAASAGGGRGTSVQNAAGAVIVNGKVVNRGAPGGTIIIDGKKVE